MMKKQDIKKLQRMIALTLSLVGGLYHMAWAELAATALPTDEKNLSYATVTRDASKPVMTIDQTKGQNRAFISWDTFNIGKDATVNIKQHSGADLLVNAVRGNSMSEIAGKLNATGNVALINPNGVIFMKGAQVNVGGLGVYATGYDATNQKFLSSGGKEGRIEIQSGATINAGVSAALKNLSALNIDPKDYAIAIDSTGEDGYTNRIHLIADGNVEIQGGSKLTAKDYTYIGPNASVGDEGFSVGVGAIGMGGKIYIRSDRDADDYGQVIITHGDDGSKPVMQSVNGASIYTNADQVDADSTKPGVNAAVSRTESGDGATVTYYTKHDYKNLSSYDIDGSVYTDGTSVSVDGPGITADKLSNESDAKNKISTSYAGNGKTTVTTSLLVNNIDQLQDMEDENTGNLDGRYVPGHDINATDDAHSYIDDGVLYTKNSDGSVKKWSTADGVEITGTKSDGNLSKTVNGTTIGYSKDENKATTKLTDGTTLSNSNGTVGAENTQWSTTKDKSTVTDKTAGSTYTIQSDNKSVVDKDGLTSDTSTQTVTDGSSYTANISKNTVTHTSDNSVTDTSAKTVTKPAGTSNVGYTATITDGTDTAAGTTGTIAIKGITYTVTNGSVGDTVTYQGSSVTTGTSTVKTGGVTTVVANDGTVADAVKEGTIAGDTVTVNGTTTTVTNGTASYQITTGTDAVTYTKGTTTASISGTEVTMGEVSADTSAGTVTKGDTTAAITGDTTGTVTYNGQKYTVSDGTVSKTDSITGETITVTGEDAANVLTIFSDAKKDLSNAQSIYSGYTTDATKAQNLTNTLDAAIETLKKVTDKSTTAETVLENFGNAANQLKNDTGLFNTASAALTNATTALSQYNALQKAITDNTNLETSLKQAYDEFQSTHLDETTINNIHSDKWDGGKGFNPIGDSTNPFTGTIDGFSGERVFGISNLTINRPDEENVGLVGAAGTSGNSADFVNLYLRNVSITGKNKVGAIAGTLQNGSHISWSGTTSISGKSDTSGTVTGSGESLGGLVGLVDNSSMWDVSNSATVQGKSTDGKDKKIGGIVGTLKNSSTLTDVRNFGAISGTEDVGGIAGYVENGTILGTGSAVYNYANTYNTGKVTGTTDTGGIVGHAKGIYMYGVFNTNEDAPLSKTSQLIIDDNNKVIQRGDGTTSEAGTSITAESLQSGFGKVKGGTNTGGLVGYLEDAPGFSKTVTNINISSKTKTDADGTTTKEAVEAAITNNVIDTSYNAGNITGTGDNTGGLVGQMTGGTLSNVYNADNNTVLREQGTIPDAVKNAEIKDTSDNSKTYKYSAATVSDCSSQDLTQYYSFFTVDDSGSRTYYYFLPVSTTSGTTQKGAGGIYVTADGNPAASLPSTKERYYFNRTFNKDANVTGTGKNTGGLVGSMTTAGTTAKKYSAGSVIDSAYNAGTITGNSTDTTTTGALVGSKDAASLINDSFYVIGKDVTNGKVYSNVNQAVGTSVTDTSRITDTGSLDAVESKKKYYVSDDSKRTNFPGVQQKTLTEKGETDSKTTTYYEYTSGTNGSFYTDGTGSMDSISHIYPITTTGTTDSSTGKTTYTSTRSATAAYTRQKNGTFQDAGGNTYTAAYDTATRQIVLTPVSGSSSTAATVVLNAVLAARTANETWTIYEDQTRPLLTAFLNKASLSRTFSYDGTTHNLKTDDVANLYGRADFDGDAGKDVQLSNYQLSSNGVSSEYTYDNTSIWSPQHGYYMDPESTLVINPVNMSANLYGTRVYGDIFNTRGYYVCVPYTENGTKKYSFYKPVEESGKEGYTLLKDTDSDNALTHFFGDYEQTEDGLLKLAEEKGFYVLELNGFINGEGVDNLGKLITGLVSTLSNSSSTTTTSGSNLQHLFSSVTADTYLDAGIYNVTNAQITGLTATNQNYTINYGGTLTVKQAELYYTYDGSRGYGLQNTDPSAKHTYTLVGVDSDQPDSNGKYTSTHGFLKYWDFKNDTIKNDDGTETTIDNPYKNFFKKNGNTYEINQDNIGVTGYTAEKTTTTTDVTTGKSTTETSKDDTKSASLDDIYTNMTGTINKDSINLPSTDTEKVIGSYGDGAVNGDMYTHVLVDAEGKPIGYKVTSFASSNKDADGTIQLYFKASSDTTNTADKNMQAAVDKFNKNYKLVWKEGGTYDKVYTIGNPEKPTPSGDAGIKTEAGKLKVNDSTFTILPKTATVTITGNRQYGDTMDTSAYSTTVGSITAGLSKDNKDKEQYNIDIDGLTNSDTKDNILDKDKTTALLEKIDQKDGSAADAGTQINKYTNVKRDVAGAAEAQNINDFEKSKISVVNGDASTDKMNVTSTTTTDGTTSTTTYDNSSSILTSNNYDYILQDGTHQLKITPVSIKVTVNGSKTYGDFTSQTAKDYTTSIEMGDKTTSVGNEGKVTLKTGEVADIVIANNLDEKSNAGTYQNKYTYSSSNPANTKDVFTISLSNDSVENANKKEYVAGNYDLSFETTYTIDKAPLWYTYEGSRNYGEDNTTTTNTFKLVGVDGADSNERVRGFLKSWDVDTYKVDTANGNTIALTPGGADDATLYAMSGMADAAYNKQDTTIRSITGGNSDSTYSHVIVDSTGKVIGYNLSSLGLASDDKLKLKDATQEQKDTFKNNYKLVWKPQVQAGTDGKGTILSSQKTTASVKDAAGTISTNTAKTINVGASTLTINPVALTVEVTGKREYGHTMGDKYVVSTNPAHTTLNADGTGVVNTSGLTNETYNINLDGLKNDDDKTILDDDAVKKLLSGIDAGDSTATNKISRYTSVKQSGSLATDIDYQGEKVYAYDLTKKSGNSDYTGSQITVTGKTGASEANHYDLLAKNNYDYTLQNGTHTLTIDRHDLNLNITAERKYGDISNQKVVSDYKNDAKASGTVPSYATGVTGDANGLQNGETIDFTQSTVALSDKFAQADAGTYQHDWYNDDTSKGYNNNGAAGITNITLKAGNGSGFNAKNYNIHYTTTYKVDKADLYYTYDGERSYGEDNSAAAHTYTIVGQDGDSSKESVRGYLKSWDSGVLADGSNILKKDLLTVRNADGNSDGKAYTMTGVAIQDAGTQSADNAANIAESERNTSQSIGKNSGYSHVIVDKDGNILSYTLDSLGTKIAGKDSTGTLAKNYNLVWKQGGDSNKLDKVYTTATTNQIDGNGALQATTDTVNKITVNNSSFKINPLALTVTVTGKRDYGDSMNAQSYTTNGTAGKDQYNISVTGDFANGETADSVLNKDNVESMLKSLENDTDAARENSNGENGRISRYTDVKRNADDKSKIDSYNLNVDSKDTSSTITLASKVTKSGDKVTSIEHADKADSSHGFNVLNDNNYDYIINDGTHTLTINPVDLTVDVKGESTYGKTDTKYTVTDVIGAKNNERPTVGDATKSNIENTSAAGSYTVTWMDKNGTDVSSPADDVMGEYLTTAERRSDNASSITGKKTADGIRTVKLVAGKNDDNSGLSTFNSNNYNITYHTTQVINPEKITITIDGTKVYGSQSADLTSDAAKITGVVSGDAVPNVKIIDNMKQTLIDAGTYHHDWSSYAGISDKKESYTYVDTDGNSYTVDKDKAFGVTGVVVEETPGFSFNNYDIDFKSTYTVTPRPLQLDVTSTSIYGDPKAGYTYRAALDPTGNTEEGLVGNQKFNPTDIKVSDDITEASDAGTYTHTAAGTSYTDASNNPQNSTYKGIMAVAADSLKDAGNTGFKSSNYAVTLHQGTHTVKPRDLKIKITGEKTYGDSTSISGRDYKVFASGLQNNETIDFNDATVLHSAETGDRFSNAGEYHSSDGKGILGFEDSTLHGDGFKLGNYELTYDTVFTIDKRPVDVYMESRRMSGSPSSVRMDEPMTMRNVPEAHQGRFLADMQVIDTALQVIAARDYPGFDGSGYLDLRFAGDIYRNYIIHRHTIYHILPDRMMKPSVYYAVQPVRRPILDVMYFKVNGSEGINRWAGTEKQSYAGEIILNRDVTNSIQAAPDIMKKPGLPAHPGQEFLKEEVTQAVPVVYTDGRKQDVRGRYHLAYEDNHVVIYPASDDVSVPRLKERPVSSEIRRVMRVPYQGGEGEYHVAYADGIVQVYPQNETAYRLVQAKGKDEQLLLQSSLTSAVRELGASLEDIGAVYVYTK